MRRGRIAAAAVLAAGTVSLHVLADMLPDSIRQAAADIVLGPPAATSPSSDWMAIDAALLADLGRAVQGFCIGGHVAQAAQGSAHFADLRGVDLASARLQQTETYLPRTEAWESGAGAVPGYPAVVHNTSGPHADGRLLAFYSVHDAPAGIGLATAETLIAPFEKHAQNSGADSRILTAPARPRVTSHFSSPSVVWDPGQGHWRLYFHYYANEHENGMGHQKTGVAMAANPTSDDWRVLSDAEGRIVATLPVHPDWANSQSSYHVVARLADGLWVALLRGTNAIVMPDGTVPNDSTSLAIAVSADGLAWAPLPGSPFATLPIADGVLRPVALACTRDMKLSALWHHDSRDPAFAARVRAAPLDALNEPRDILLDWRPDDGGASMFETGGALLVFSGNSRHFFTTTAP